MVWFVDLKKQFLIAEPARQLMKQAYIARSKSICSHIKHSQDVQKGRRPFRRVVFHCVFVVVVFRRVHFSLDDVFRRFDLAINKSRYTVPNAWFGIYMKKRQLKGVKGFNSPQVSARRGADR